MRTATELTANQTFDARIIIQRIYFNSDSNFDHSEEDFIETKVKRTEIHYTVYTLGTYFSGEMCELITVKNGDQESYKVSHVYDTPLANTMFKLCGDELTKEILDLAHKEDERTR